MATGMAGSLFLHLLLLLVVGLGLVGAEDGGKLRLSQWERDMTFSFMDHYNAKDLSVFYYKNGYPDVKSLSRDLYRAPESVEMQIAIFNFTNHWEAPPNLFKSALPSLKLFLLDGNDESDVEGSFEWLARISPKEEWSVDNLWMVGPLPDQLGRADLERLFGKLALNYMSHVFAFATLKEGIKIYEVYKISVDDRVAEVLEYARWIPNGRLLVNKAHLWQRRWNLKGKHIKASALHNIPYETHLEDGCTGPDCFKGMFADVWHSLQDIMNFTYKMYMPEDGQWGALREDGTWTGIVGQLDEEEVDVAAADFSTTLLRADYVNFLPTIDEIHMRVFIANPAESFNWYAYTRPYTRQSWYAIGIMVVLLTPFVSFIMVKDHIEPTWMDYTLLRSFAFISGAVAMRDWQATPWTSHAKITCFFVLFLGTLLYYHWEAMIISYLAVRTTSLPFNDFSEMLSLTDYKIVVQYGTAFVDNIKYSNKPLYQQVWNERMEPYVESFPLTKDGLTEMVLNDNTFAMLDNYNTRIYYDDYISCQTVDIPKEYFHSRYAMLTSKRFPYFEAMTYHTNVMKERGSLQQIKDRYRNPPQVCPNYSGRPLGFGQTFTAFIVFFLGFGLAIVVLVVEILTNFSDAARRLASKLAFLFLLLA